MGNAKKTQFRETRFQKVSWARQKLSSGVLVIVIQILGSKDLELYAVEEWHHFIIARLIEYFQNKQMEENEQKTYFGGNIL